MYLQDLIQIVTRLSIQEKVELVAFVRDQTTGDLGTALDEIAEKLHAMGVLDAPVAPNLQSAQERLAALQALSKLL
jgi:hypothetical protein